MILMYDWQILKNYKVKDILIVLHYLTGDLSYAPKNVLRIISKFGIRDSFLLEPYNLVTLEINHTDEEIYQYLELASLRSYSNYIKTGSKNLPTDYIREYEPYKFNNSALIVDKDEIIFKYEA